MVDSKTIKKIPFARPYLGDEEHIKNTVERIGNMMRTGVVSNGDYCRDIEEKVAKMSGADYALTTSSCTQAMMIMIASSTSRGVLGALIPSFTWPSTLIAINAQKYQDGVRLMDVSPETWCVEHFPTVSHPCIALAVDTFGNDTNPTSDIPIFFDRAHSLGVKFRQIGMASALSFSPSKIITGGEGGIILSNKKKFVEAMEQARNLTCRMSEFQAIPIFTGLKLLPEMLDWKADTYITYRNAFKEFQFQKEVNTNHQVIGMLLDTHEQRERVLERCPEIEFKAYYEPLHTKFGKNDPNLTITDDLFRRILCLPSWYGVDRQYVISRIKEVLET